MSHYIDLKDGAVLDEDGNKIGTHHGAILYTYGQRHGFTIDTVSQERSPFYVVGKDCRENTVTVATRPRELATTDTVELKSMNWISDIPSADVTLAAQFRYRQKPFGVTISAASTESCSIMLAEEQSLPAEGQSCVLYAGEECVGGGILTG